MDDFLLRLRSQLIDFWKKTTMAQKAIIIGSTVLIIVALTFFIRAATQPDYVLLFDNLDAASAQSAIDKLKEQKIEPKVDGNKIYVPSNVRDEQRIKLASENIASGNVASFSSLYDGKTNFGETDADRKVKFLRATQGELTRTIESIPTVKSARVHIVTPEPSLFDDKKNEATAAVWLQLNGQKMQESQINGIIKMVSSSVEGLKPQNVTVVDTFGNVLSGKYNADSDSAQTMNLSETQLQLRQKTQESYQNSIQSMLDKVMGMGQSVVRVQVDLDMDKVEINKVEHNGNKVVVSQQKNEETTKNTSGSGGVPGTTSNTGDSTTYTTTDGSGNSESTKSNNITNNAVDESKEHRVVNPGSVKKMSVAVVFNGEVDQQKQKAIEDVVSNAAGLDTKRGDKISVVAMPFNTKYEDDVKAAMSKDETKQMIFTYGGAALAVLAVGLFILAVYKRVKKWDGFVAEEDVFPVDVSQVKHQTLKERELTPEERERQLVKEQVEKLATQNPANVAALLKTWLAEE